MIKAVTENTSNVDESINQSMDSLQARPPELQSMVLKYLDFKDKLNASLTCKSWMYIMLKDVKRFVYTD